MVNPRDIARNAEEGRIRMGEPQRYIWEHRRRRRRTVNPRDIVRERIRRRMVNPRDIARKAEEGEEW